VSSLILGSIADPTVMTDLSSMKAESNSTLFVHFCRAEDSRQLLRIRRSQSLVGIQGLDSIHFINNLCMTDGAVLIWRAAYGRHGAHRTAEVKGKGGCVQGTQLGHLIGSIEDHLGHLDKREAKDGIYCRIWPACNKEGGWSPFAHKVRHMELERNREVRGDRCTTLLNNAAQNDWIMVRCAVDRGNGVGKSFRDCHEVMEIAHV
jgi:hypothetical protein